MVYLSASRLPSKMAGLARDVLLQAIGRMPLISVTREPLEFGHNVADDGPLSMSNIYRQLLRAAKLAMTPFIAVAEDDTLYPKEHFAWRPPADRVYYDQNRMALFTWGEPLFHWRNRKSNSTLIAPRELLVDALEERFAKWPNGTPEHLTGEVGREMVERNLGLTHRKAEEVFSSVSTVQINHDFASEDRQRRHRKSYGPIRAYEIPRWGRAEHVLRDFQ